MQITAKKDIAGPVSMKKGETRNVRDGIATALVASGYARRKEESVGDSGESDNAAKRQKAKGE